MALTVVCINGFDAASTAALMGTLNGLTIPSGWTRVAGRIEGGAIDGSGQSMANPLVFDAPHVAANGATFLVACSFWMTVGTTYEVFRLKDDAGNIHLKFYVTDTGKIRVDRGDDTVLATSSAVISNERWTDLEFKVHIDDAAGIVDVAVNGVQVISGTALDTKNGGNANIERVEAARCRLDDVVMWTASVTTDAKPGPVRVRLILPVADVESDFTPDTGLDNYARVDDPSPDDDTSHVEAINVNDTDRYSMASVARGDTVVGLRLLVNAKKTDISFKEIKNVVELSATEDVPLSGQILTTTYTYYEFLREGKPGGGDWTEADINTATFGQRVTA